METCMRGFSYMPETKVEMDLKFVESKELERTWKITRRQRLKQQEQKIWEEFVKEQDIVRSVSDDDPYQFLEQLDEDCIKELLDIELQKMKKEKSEEEEKPPETNIQVVEEHQQIVTFADDVEQRDDCDMTHIFDDEISGPEEEILNDSMGSPPLTVRERNAEEKELSPAPENSSPDKMSSKSSAENVSNMIESSIYCAKVKELRGKINEELNYIIEFLECKDILNIDPSDLPKMMKRSVEFCSRFNRVHMYQLQRQVHDIERNNSGALPFALRTHFQSQMVRIVSLHQNLLHSTQVYLKSLVQTACMRESGDLLHSLIQLIEDVNKLCLDVRAPAGLNAASDLYCDDVPATNQKLKETLIEYSSKMSNYLNSTDNTSASFSRKSSKVKGKRKSIGTWSKSGKSFQSAADARLSMYSLDTLRGGLPKSSSSKDNQSSGTSKMRGSVASMKPKPAGKEDSPKRQKRSPRSRRPLMRGPQLARPKRLVTKEQDVHTLVENVTACCSSHISREQSPQPTPRSRNTTPRKSKESTPKAKTKDNKNTINSIIDTPRIKTINSPKPKRHNSPNITDRKPTFEKVARDIETSFYNRRKNVPEHKRSRSQSPETRKDEKGDVKPPVMERDANSKPQVEVKERIEVAGIQETEKTDGERKKSERDKNKVPDMGPSSIEVTRLLRQLCGGDASGSRSERVSGAKNAQLLCVNGGSPRQPSTPQLLRILEETIQKKKPKSLFPKAMSPRDAERYRMTLNLPERVTNNLFQYRTKFVQHMLTSPMYANSAVGKPWEKIGSVSEQIIDELLLNCVREMELQPYVKGMYRSEMC